MIKYFAKDANTATMTSKRAQWNPKGKPEFIRFQMVLDYAKLKKAFATLATKPIIGRFMPVEDDALLVVADRFPLFYDQLCNQTEYNISGWEKPSTHNSEHPDRFVNGVTVDNVISLLAQDAMMTIP